MPWCHIGDCGDGQLPHERDWIVQCMEWAIEYLRWVVPEPDGFELGVMWHEHELGDYPSIGVQWSGPWSEPPEEFVQRCEQALRIFDDSIKWSSINPAKVLGDFEDAAENTKMDDEDDL
jgi:hypothetical protein